MLKAIAVEVVKHYPPQVIKAATYLSAAGEKGLGSCAKNRDTHLAELKCLLAGA